jgi:hypothetical protein
LHLSRLVVLLAILALFNGCGGDDKKSSVSVRHTGPGTSNPAPSTGSTSVTNNNVPLKFKVVGKCYSETGGGTLLAKSSGFTPDSTYSRAAWYPKKPGAAARSEYSYLVREGHTTANGKAYFEWDCGKGANGQPDPPGRYKLRVTDDSTGRGKTVFFRILPAKK